MNPNNKLETRLETMSQRKLLEIEHSDFRRQIVTAYEYHTDTFLRHQKTKYVLNGTDYQRYFSNMKFYSVTRSSFAYRDKFIYKGIQGCTVLDYCCGNGEVAVEMAKKGAAKVIGIDISQVAVRNANHLSKLNGVKDRSEFRVMDAENTEFSNNMFDVIHEYGAFHHLDLEAALKELSRILKPNGKVICTEALRHNPIIHNYRKRTPHLRTEWECEHILGVPEIIGGLKYFENVTVRYFHLLILLGVPFRKRRFFMPLLAILDGIDRVLLKIPYIQRLAWIAVFVYSRPREK